MQTDPRIPLVHFARLKKSAEATGCQGLVQFIEIHRRAVLALLAAKRAVTRGDGLSESEVDLPLVMPFGDDPGSERAWDVLLKVIEERYAAREKAIVERFGDDDEEGNDCYFRFVIYMVETVPTLDLVVRAVLDRDFERAAEGWSRP